MSLARHAKRADTAQAAIVQALRLAGVQVWVIGWPCDLLTLYQGRWQPLEVKTPTKTCRRRARNDQQAQAVFLATTGVPVVMTPREALDAVGVGIFERIGVAATRKVVAQTLADTVGEDARS